MFVDEIDNPDEDPYTLNYLLRQGLIPRKPDKKGFSAIIESIKPMIEDQEDFPAWEPDIIVRTQLPHEVNSWRRRLYQIRVTAGSRQDVGQRTPYLYGKAWALGHLMIGGVQFAHDLPPVTAFNAAGYMTTMDTTKHRNFIYPCGVLVVNNTIYVRSYPALVGLHAIIAHGGRLVETTGPTAITITTKNNPPLLNCHPRDEEYHVLSTF
nr:MAG TPA: hypothetical protein [Caudoviricetes sp.]